VQQEANKELIRESILHDIAVAAGSGLSSPAVVDAVIYIGSYDGYLYALTEE